MLSRIASSIYWLNRYIERAENYARFIEVNLNLTLDLPRGTTEQWEPLVATTGDHESFADRCGKATKEAVIQFLSIDALNPNSILSCLTAARENARSVREIISTDMWEQVIYPQGNWVEVSEGTPYCIIGETGYGKPLLDRVLRYHSNMDLALKVGFLAFDATRTSSTSVEYPLDVVLYRHDTFDIVEQRFQKEDLAEISAWWQSRIYESVEKLPSKWIDRLLDSLPHDTRSSPKNCSDTSS